jgi:poly(3-hydroxybutyrate) depolymerase
MRRATTVFAAAAMAIGMLATSAVAAPADDRAANCLEIGGVYDEGPDSSHNTATCTVTTTDTVTSTEQVNNIKAAKQVLRTTTTTITYQTVYAFTNQGGGSAPIDGVDGEPEYGESEMVMCTPGSGYEACPDE